MALVAGDWTVTRASGNIRYTGADHNGAATYATVIEFHRWLQGLADDAVSVGDDELDITNTDPSRRSTDNIITLINGYNIDAAAAEHLYDGSIIQAGGDDIWDGIVNFGNADVQIQIIQDGAVISDDWWNEAGAGLNPSAAAGISHRFMIKTRTAGSDLDGRRLLGTCRRFGYTYAEFPINGTSRGNNVLALSDSADLNNETVEGTVSGWTTIDNTTEGYKALDVNNDTTNEFYYSEWNRAAYTINQFYERMKWLTRDGSVSTIYGLNGELFRGITHEITVDNILSGPLNAFEELTWTEATVASSGQMLAVDSVSAPTKVWIQLLKGVAPTDGTTLTGGTSGATVDVNVTVTDRSATVSTPFIGASTGSAIIGAYGVGIEIADITSSDKVTDLGANVITPPNYVQNTVAGLVNGEDRVLVGPWDGVSTDTNGDPAIEKDQLSLATILDADNETSVVVSEAIPANTPLTGYIRVTDDLGFERRLHYSGWSVSTFTIDTTDGNEDFLANEAAVANDVWIAYIDKLADASTATFTGVQDSTADLVVIVRDGGGSPIKQFISSWSHTASPQTITAIRTTDV